MALQSELVIVISSSAIHNASINVSTLLLLRCNVLEIQ